MSVEFENICRHKLSCKGEELENIVPHIDGELFHGKRMFFEYCMSIWVDFSFVRLHDRAIFLKNRKFLR